MCCNYEDEKPLVSQHVADMRNLLTTVIHVKLSSG